MSESVLNPTSEDPSHPVPPRVKVYWGHVICGVIGLGLAWYSLIVHNRIKAGESGACGISESCDVVIGSEQWGQFLGIPLGLFGMLYFAIVLLTSVSNPGKIKVDAFQRLGVAIAGLLSSLGLEYVMWVIIKAGCPVCMSIHIVTLVNFLLALAGWLKLRRPATG